MADSFGLYKGGGSASSYDRSFFNSIHNGELTRTTLKASKTAFNPRLSIVSAGHPVRVIEMLNKEKTFGSGSDGFISRFIICLPMPLRISIKQLEVNSSSQLSLKNFLAALYILNKKFLKNGKLEHFTFSQESFEILNETFESYDSIAVKFQITNGFISYVYGKALGQLLRLSGIIKLINIVCLIVKNNLSILEDSFENFLKLIESQEIDTKIEKVSY